MTAPPKSDSVTTIRARVERYLGPRASSRLRHQDPPARAVLVGTSTLLDTSASAASAKAMRRDPSIPDASYTVPAVHWIEAREMIVVAYEKDAPPGTWNRYRGAPSRDLNRSQAL